ncbi:MAG: cation diffusion facilitator family transporter, partial [Coprococcus comes]|nr:cation diffusion facilitator family transporter [Coprococcus comes]
MAQENQDSKKRAAVGKMTGFIGVLCNLLLAGSKLVIGKLAASTSITADGLNNLSDAASSIVTLLGFKLAEKPADKEHPYGHARMEYVATLAVAAIILIMGFELFRDSFGKIIKPQDIEFSWLIVAILLASIAVKCVMAVYNFY